MWNDSKRKQHFLQHEGNHNNNKEAYTDESKSTGRKVGFAAVFMDITRSCFHSHSWNDSNKNNNERDEKKRRHEMGNIYRLAELNVHHQEQQRKQSNIKSDIRNTSKASLPGKTDHSM